MTGKVVPFRAQQKPGQKPTPTLAELVARVRELAKDSNNIGFDSPHFQKRLNQRGKTMRQVLETIRKGEAVSGPTMDEYGDWRIKLRRKVAGQRVHVVVAVREKDLSALTVI